MANQYLSDSQVKEILDYLECPTKVPTLRFLNRLINAYIRRVPWESVSRIVKRHEILEVKDCPRWPEEFWQEAIRLGFGGTCFESSLAFFSLLTALGYEGYLTVNDMGDSHGCHAAIVIIINEQKYLVDITIPLHSAVWFSPQRITRRNTSFHDYTIRPLRKDVYDVERSHHPNRYAFTLIDIPVKLSAYRSIVEKDYTQTGLFLNSVVISKIIHDRVWRFFSDHRPYKLEIFNRHGKCEIFLSIELMTRILAGKFHMPEEKIFAALWEIQNPPDIYFAVQTSSALAEELNAQ